MGRRLERLQDGWDAGIPDEAWPDAIPVAVRIDVRSLAHPRVVATLERWREDLAGADDGRARMARLRLTEVGKSMIGGGGDLARFRVANLEETEAAPDFPMDQTVAAPLAAPATAESVRQRRVTGRDLEETIAPAELIDRPRISESKKRPVLRAKGKTNVASEPGTAKPAAPSMRAAALSRTLDLPAGTVEAIRLLEAALDDEEAQKGSSRRSERAKPSRVEEVKAAQPLVEISDEDEPPTATFFLAQADGKPAAEAQVLALYEGIANLCAELVPLTFERRQRRFWAHWREASGDRGVRRKAADQILRTAPDFVTLVAGLIAEVFDFSQASVRGIVEVLAAEAPPRASARPSEPAPAMPLVGSSVPIDGIE
ncbi:MAG: hypothetical protein HY791_00430 [Deltaproteobacteria bacterium]|nr:hypothetical protein [Deltaproteobacteria bacterium]